MGKPWENHGKTMGKPWENGDLCGKIHHFVAGKTHYFDWAMASIAFCMFTRG